MRLLMLVVATLVWTGCQYDPHANLYTTSEPKAADIVGTYVLETLHLPPAVGSAPKDVLVVLRGDGTFAATNVPPWVLDTPGTNFFTSLVTTTGKWEKGTLGTLDPGQRRIWGVQLHSSDPKIHPPYLTGDKPPYGLIFTLGDPDSGHAVILRRK
jgi:hypothetical protein